jgi:hypothetical protein
MSGNYRVGVASSRLNALIASGAGDDCIRIFSETEESKLVSSSRFLFSVTQDAAKVH